MKLVELLASGVSEWHDRTERLHQDGDGRIYATCRKMPKFHKEWNEWDVSGHEVIMNGEDPIYGDCFDLADDYKTNVVTRAQWQAERDRQKGGEWKRHRGGKQPVANDTQVECRMRNGDIEKFNASGFMWDHNGQDDNIMAYRVISQPQAQEVEVSKLTQDLNMQTPQGEFVRGPISLGDEVIYPAEAKWDRVDGPLLWRDTVNELDAYIEEFTRERDALIERLASEGFELIPPVFISDPESAGVDMQDWRNWKVGDVFVTDGECQYYTKGKEYSVHGLENDSAPIKAIDDNGDVYCLFMEEVKFIRRP